MIVYLLLLCLLRISGVYGQSDRKILKSSLAFVIDDTGSMGDDIQQVKLGANSIFDTIVNSNASQIENILLVTFNDPSTKLLVKTKNRDDFKRQLNSIIVTGGGDCPEYAMSGIKLALEQSLRGSNIFVFTDASAKDFGQYEDVKSLAIRMQSRVIFVLTGTCGNADAERKNRPMDYQVYYDLANITQGQVFHMNKQEINQILEYVKYIITEKKNVVSKATFPPGYDNLLPFNVDGKYKNVAISASGVNPKLSIEGPGGSIPKTKDLMKTSKILIKQILETKPGPHIAKVGSKSETDAVVTAASSINFLHGFSLYKPSSLNDTTTKPVPDTKPYLSIKLIGDGVQLQTARIVDMDDHLIKELPLEMINDKEMIYLTAPFQPPKTVFRIAVTGDDTKSKETITRTGPPVEPQNIVAKESKKPTITIDEAPKVHAEYNKPLQLKCKVNAFPEPEIIWTEKDTGVVLSTTVSVVELGSDYINILNIDKIDKNATYQCTAKNSLDVDIDNIKVETDAPIHLNVLESPKDITIEYKKEGKLICKVDAFPPPTITWLLNEKPITKDENIDVSFDGSVLIIKQMQPQLVGTVTCVATNNNETIKNDARLSITGIEWPAIDKTTSERHFIKGSNVKIDCKIIEGIPRPEVSWYFKRKIDRKYRNIDNTGESLLLNNVDSSQAGTYVCKAKNVIGTDVHKTKVYIENAPIIEEQEKNIVAKVGDEITLKCIVDGSPTPNVTWYKDDTNISNKDKYNISKDHSLRFNVTSYDTGKYVCKAENAIGSNQEIIEVTVHVKPKIDKSTSIINAKKGYDASITCKLIEGNPTVAIRWEFKPKRNRRFRLMDVSNETFSLLDVDATQSGTYRCTASNTIGVDTHEIDVAVVYPPIIKKEATRINVKNGEDLKLNCRVDGLPIPRVRWLKDGKIISSKLFKRYRDHSLRHKFLLEDKGNYTCFAINMAGRATQSIFVDVFVPVSILLPNETTINSNIGDNINFKCQADGYPRPDIMWFFYGLDTDVGPQPITPEASSSDLMLDNIESKHRGFYVCVASNDVSSANITYQLIVYAPPIITNNYPENSFKAVEGDLVLMISCNTTGYPKPSITWQQDGYDIATGSDWYDVNDKGALIIKHVDEISAGSYSCIAKNSIGSVEEFFEVNVDLFPEETYPYSKIMIERGTSASIECDVPYKKTDSLRWYKDRDSIGTGELNIDNVTITDAGMYTCRVSNFSGSSSSTVKVEVGFKPEFTGEDKTEDTNIDLEEGTLALLSCKAVGVPEPKASWWHDGKEIVASDNMMHAFQMKLNDRGKYQCKISNKFGNIFRTFVIKSNDCFLNIERDFPVNQPFIEPSTKFLMYDTVDGYLRIPKDDYVSLSCPKKFKRFTNSHILAFCKEESNFKVNGKAYKYSDFECTEEIKPVIKQTGIKCLPGSRNTEKVQVVYEVSRVTVQIYEICLDIDRNVPIYTKHNIQRSTADVALNTTEWLNSDLVPLDFTTLYDCERQINTISSELGRWFHRSDNCCFFKRQLVSPRDMTPGLAQKATFNNLNVVPQWGTCNNKNWDDMETKVRALAKSTDHKLLVWSGTSNHLEMPSVTNSRKQINFYDKDGNSQPVPRFIWKVVQDPRTAASLAIIQVNVPDLTVSNLYKYVLCRDICKNVAWMKIGTWHDITKGYTYCCTIQDFERAFEYSGVFDSKYSNILYSTAHISNYTLT